MQIMYVRMYILKMELQNYLSTYVHSKRDIMFVFSTSSFFPQKICTYVRNFCPLVLIFKYFISLCDPKECYQKEENFQIQK